MAVAMKSGRTVLDDACPLSGVPKSFTKAASLTVVSVALLLDAECTSRTVGTFPSARSLARR